MNTLISRLEEQFEASFAMLVAEIEACPDSLWYEMAAGFPFWQQVVHALSGTDHWFGLDDADAERDFAGRRLFPELDGEPEGNMSKGEMREYAETVAAKARRFFAGLEAEALSRAGAEESQLSKLDIVCTQIRHLMYHAGHCDAALRDRGLRSVEWKEIGSS
jgi:hypothetical protein